MAIRLTRKTYLLFLPVICIALIPALGIGLTSGNPVFMGIIILLTVLLVWLFHHQVGEVMQDDLSDCINGKAAVRTLEIMIIIAAILFAGSMTYYFNSGWGSGMSSGDDGSVSFSYASYFPHGTLIYRDQVEISNIGNMTGEDLYALERLFGDGYRFRDAPFVFGLAFGCVVVLLAGFYLAFSYYYDKRFEA